MPKKPTLKLATTKTKKPTAKKKSVTKSAAKPMAKKALAKKPTAKVIELKSKQPVKQAVKPQPKKTHAPPKESFFTRLLREKKERQQAFQQQNQHVASHKANTPLPENHTKYSKFAGPRRRAV